MQRPSRSYTGPFPGAARDQAHPAKGKLLIIDDDRSFVALAATILRDAGYLVLEAYDAAQGFMFASHEPPDLFLVDMLMPAGGGMNVLERVRHNERLAKVPIIVVTASTDEGLEAKVKAKGADHLLQKPLDRDSLLSLVAAALAPSGKPPQLPTYRPKP